MLANTAVSKNQGALIWYMVYHLENVVYGRCYTVYMVSGSFQNSGGLDIDPI